MFKRKIVYTENRIRYIICLIHWLLTFLWEEGIFKFSINNWEIYNSIPKKEYISKLSEMVIVYILSKICAGIIIWLLWKLIFSVIKKRIQAEIVIIFVCIFCIGGIIAAILYPNCFGLEIDNYTNFLQAKRFLPTYWQSIYTGVIYAGCMMVIPHPFSVIMFQWMSFVVVIAYIYQNVSNLPCGNYRKNLLLLLFVFPESYYIAFNPYRNNMYTILCLFYFSYIIFSYQSEKYGMKQIILVAILSAFVMVWRSEGILLGVCGISFVFMFKSWKQWKKNIAIICMSIIIFCIFNLIQGIGTEKYYGKDYNFINTTNVLYSILNNPNANLNYEGAEEDLNAIDKVIPINVLKELSMKGYRNYNWTEGREDFNQSLVNDKTADQYMSAYYSIISNNIVEYLDVQINHFFKALAISARHTTYSYEGEINNQLENYIYEEWRIGKNELMEIGFTYEWENSYRRNIGYSVISWIILVWQEIWTATGINTILHAGSIIALSFIGINSLIELLKSKHKSIFGKIIISFFLICQIIAIVLFMPEGRSAYFYPVLYTTYLLIYFHIINVFEIFED